MTNNGSQTSKNVTSSNGTAEKKGPSVHEIYAQPAPIKTFPLPSFYPANPLSIIYLAYAWIKQIAQPPPKEPLIIHQATWSAATTSVHVTDEASMMALWQQGFYGKGTLSRSEPNWLKRELVRRGLGEGYVSEIATLQRRDERIQAKWERARLEQEAIRQTRLEESRRVEQRRSAQFGASVHRNVVKTTEKPKPISLLAPVGPLELLALPNSTPDLPQSPLSDALSNGVLPNGNIAEPHVDEGSLTIGDFSDLFSKMSMNGNAGSPSPTQTGSGEPNGTAANGVVDHHDEVPLITRSAIPGLSTLQSRKSVRFSPTVESTTFEISDPPSPGLGEKPFVPNNDEARSANGFPPGQEQDLSGKIVNKEHLQLMPEEALWLSFGLGALAVSDPLSGRQLSLEDMLTLFRQYSYYPPRVGSGAPALQPDDEFLVHYAVYHHFRSLGWVPRAGIKFGVDWLLYTKGPVFDHAEFGLVVIPAYTDPYWKSLGKRSPQKTWYFLHSIVRVLSHVLKSLVVVYVDVPSPIAFDESMKEGFGQALKLYRVREVMIKRWAVNRNR